MSPLPPSQVCPSITFVKIVLTSAVLAAGLMLSRAGIQNPVPLWPAGAPGALGTSSNDIPTLTAYLPAVTNATRTAMVICPGGAYENVDSSGGNGYALWLNQYGVTCFVLKYRVSSHGYHYPAMINDATRAVRWVRAQADKFNVSPKHVGIMGVSAGGHLAATTLTHFDKGDPSAADPVERQSSRPDFGVLCYPIITMEAEFSNPVTRDALLGPNPPTSLVRLLSNESHVTTETPPCFLWTSFADNTARMENTMMFAEALRKNRVEFELHVYERGRHGAGLKLEPPFTNSHAGLEELQRWLKKHKWANQDPNS